MNLYVVQWSSLTLITEVEKFVIANTQELAKDKWLCPLSGKKFKGPDFVRKHIFNKHAEKIEEVKKEVCPCGRLMLLCVLKPVTLLSSVKYGCCIFK